MAHIRRIEVRIETANESGADADGPVFLGVGSREFRLARSGDNQFEQGDVDDFVLDENDANSTVNNPEKNNPTKPIRIEQHEVEDTNYSVYIIYDSNKKWLVKNVIVKLSGGGGPDLTYTPYHGPAHGPRGIDPPGLWLGGDSGKILYLSK